MQASNTAKGDLLQSALMLISTNRILSNTYTALGNQTHKNIDPTKQLLVTETRFHQYFAAQEQADSYKLTLDFSNQGDKTKLYDFANAALFVFGGMNEMLANMGSVKSYAVVLNNLHNLTKYEVGKILMVALRYETAKLELLPKGISMLLATQDKTINPNCHAKQATEILHQHLMLID